MNYAFAKAIFIFHLYAVATSQTHLSFIIGIVVVAVKKLLPNYSWHLKTIYLFTREYSNQSFMAAKY